MRRSIVHDAIFLIRETPVVRPPVLERSVEFTLLWSLVGTILAIGLLLGGL